MPFDPLLLDLYDLGIREPLEAVGFSCQRIDDITFSGDVLKEIRRQIETADLIVAVITGHNSNVLFEVGIAYALGKRVILLIDDAVAIPSDLKNEQHLVDTSIKGARAKLVPLVSCVAASHASGRTTTRG
jgi:aromatic ring-opening dioxygenase LigB subunit